MLFVAVFIRRMGGSRCSVTHSDRHPTGVTLGGGKLARDELRVFLRSVYPDAEMLRNLHMNPPADVECPQLLELLDFFEA